MTKYALFISESAAKDLEKISDYIAIDLLEPLTALKQITRIKDVIMDLNHLPERHPTVRDEVLALKGIRIIPVDNYLVFYTVNTQELSIDVIRVLYSRRNWEYML